MRGRTDREGGRRGRARGARRLQGAFGGALVALSATASMLVGARGVAVIEMPGSVHGLLRLPPAPHEGLGVAWSALATWPQQLQDAALNRMAGAVVVLVLAATSVALLNVLVLLLEAGASRRGEVAIRAALGAPPIRLVSLLLGDIRRLVAISIPVGILLGVCAGALLRVTWPGALAPVQLPGGAGVVAAALFASAAVAAVAYASVGIAAARARDLAGDLGTGERVTDDAAVIFRRRILSVLHVGLAGSVAVAAIALARAVQAPRAGRAEADARDTVVVPVVARGPVVHNAGTPGASRQERVGEVWQAVLARLAAVPGIEVESLATPGALVGLGVRDYDTGHCGHCIVGLMSVPFLNALADHYAVGPGYFDLTGGRVIEGRAITAADGPSAPKVAVVNESFARAVFGHGALGHTMRVGWGSHTWYTVVGVVADQAPAVVGRDNVPRPQVYLSALQEPPARAQLLLRGSHDGVRAAEALLAARGYDPGKPRTVAEVRSDAAEPLVWLERVAWVLGLVALLLAMHGSYAAALQVTRRRRQELSVRRALGATDRRVLLFVLVGSARNALWGGALAVMLGTFWVGLVRRTSAGVPSPAIGVYLATVVVLVGVSVVASLKAAREAVATEPRVGMA